MHMKVALITGITGQDGSYLAELLLAKGYQVHGIHRRNSNSTISTNISHIRNQVHLHEGDMQDGMALANLIMHIKPHEVYNLAAQSHVHTSFQLPEYTCDTNSLGVLRLLEAVRLLHETRHPVRFYQAGTSEMFGKVAHTPQTEHTPFYPRSPYGVSKVFSHFMCVNYRESYHMHVNNGILFNHESVRRGEQFVTRKITLQTARWRLGVQPTVKLGNLDAERDWGHARDFVRGMWLIMQQHEPDDYVLATGMCHSVKHFCERVAAWHDIKLIWQGDNQDQKGVDMNTGRTLFECVPEFYRPSEVDVLQGDAHKARIKLGWQPEHTLDDLINEMCAHDWALAKKEHAHV
jgi:GDPmannose 4,6-dehydratase